VLGGEKGVSEIYAITGEKPKIVFNISMLWFFMENQSPLLIILWNRISDI